MFLAFVLLILHTLDARDNPFRHFVGQPYGMYHYALQDSVRVLFDTEDSVTVLRCIDRLKLFPDHFKNHQWQLESDYLKARYVHDCLHGSDSTYMVELYRIADDAEKYGNRIFRIRTMRTLFELYKKTFDLWRPFAAVLESDLERVDAGEFPGLVDAWFALANIYFDYEDYPRAEKFLLKIISVTPDEHTQFEYIHALNNMGLIYREYHRDYAESDRWFRAIIDFNSKYGILDRPDQWTYIVIGNLAKNQLLRGNYLSAINGLRSSLEYMESHKDFGYSYMRCIDLIACHVFLGETEEAAGYIDKARYYAYRAHIDWTEQTDLFRVLSRFYMAEGNTDLANTYIDSTFLSTKEYDRLHNITGYVQDMMSFGREAYDGVVNDSRSRHRREMILLIIGILLLSGISAFFVVKRREYLALREEARQMSDKSRRETIPQIDKETSLLPQIIEYINTTECYRDQDLNLESLARRIGVNRTKLSVAVNASGDNFATFINKFRVHEAIRIMEEAQEKMNLDIVAEHVGFSNRRSLHNAFIAIVGAPPGHYSAE